MTLSTRREFPTAPDALVAAANAYAWDESYEIRYDVRQMVAGMDPKLRAVAEARWIFGRSRRETQDRLGLTRWEVWLRERQARAYLAAKWGEG